MRYVKAELKRIKKKIFAGFSFIINIFSSKNVKYFFNFASLEKNKKVLEFLEKYYIDLKSAQDGALLQSRQQ